MKKRVTIKSNYVILIGVAFLLCAAIIKLLYVSVSPKVDGISLTTFAENRNTKTKILYASRGNIYDASGDALALSVNSYTLIAYLSNTRTTDESNPQHVVDKLLTSQKLAPILGMDENDILKILSKNKYQVEFGSKGKNLTESIKSQIDDLELPGIDFIEGTQRYYKMGDFASYIVGYAKQDDKGNIIGEMGVEGYYNDELSGTDGSLTYESDAYGYQLPNKPVVRNDAQSGDNIYLTIDSNIELITENAIRTLEKDYEFDWALMTVMDASTGAIVATSTSPSFNPNNLNTLENYLNPLVSNTYEPGSTMKVFSWSSAIEDGLYDGNKTYESGSINVADVTIRDANKTGWGTITFDKGFAMSSNVAASYLSHYLGREKLQNYYRKFGFGKKTGIELSGEVEGDMDFYYESEVASAAFGQGITVTPIQMLQALTSITNKGTMLKPYIVSKIVDQEGNIKFEASRKEVDQVMKESTAKKMQELMYNANYDGLTNVWQPSTVKMLGKTGTSQIASPSGGYMTGEYDNIYSLSGIFPSENPKYIIYVAVKRIIGTQGVVGRMTTKAVDEIAAYANITETNKDLSKDNIVTIKNMISTKTIDSKKFLEGKKLKVITLGSGDYVINQYPLANSKVVNDSKVFLITNKDDYVMEDLTGWSLQEVQNYAKLVGLNLSTKGYGYVKEQSIPKEEKLKKDMILNVSLE